MTETSDFLNIHEEKASMNQYWWVLISGLIWITHSCLIHDVCRYSQLTIDKIVEDLRALPVDSRIAFLSTPSLYFSLTENQRKLSFVFDYDRVWENDRGFVFYDFNEPENVPSELSTSFDCVVIDPPFITKEVWEKYAITSKLLLKPGGLLFLQGLVNWPTENCNIIIGRILLTTIIENAELLKNLLDVSPTVRSNLLEVASMIDSDSCLVAGISTQHPSSSLSVLFVYQLSVECILAEKSRNSRLGTSTLIVFKIESLVTS